MGGTNFNTRVRDGLKKCFGDKEFITYYWRIYTPALFYGIFYAFAPIIVSNLFALADKNIMVGITNDGNPITQGQFINLVYTQGNSLWNSMYFFVVAVVRAGVGPVGSAISKNNHKEIHSTLRLLFWLITFISLIMMFSICFDSQEILVKLQLVGSQIDNTDQFKTAVTQYVDWTAITLFIYGIGMLYQPMFSTYKKTFPQMFAALFGFVFILIAAPCYIVASASPNQTFEQVVYRCNMTGLIIDFYYFALVFFYIIYCLCPWVIIIQSTSHKVLTNKYYIEQHNQFTIEANVERIELYKSNYFLVSKVKNITTVFNIFKTGIWFTLHDVRAFFHIGWSVFIDQIIWSIANVFLIIFSTNVNIASWQPYNTAAKTASLLNNYVYSVANSFSVLPSAFVAYELGLNHIQKAKENGWRLYFWGTATAAILMVVIFIIASFMPGLTVTNPDVIGLSIGLTMIFGVSVLFNSAYQIALNILFSGGNRWVQLNNSLVTIINSFAIIVVINNRIVYHGLWNEPTTTQFVGYYVIGKSYVVVKFIIATILLAFTNWFHNSSEIDKNKGNSNNKLSWKNKFSKKVVQSKINY